GFDEEWWRARPFYGVVALGTLVGLVIPFTGVKPIDALFFTSVLNGVAAPFLLVVIMLVARNTKVMGQQTIGPVLTVLGWTVTIAIFVARLGLAMTSFGAEAPRATLAGEGGRLTPLAQMARASRVRSPIAPPLVRGRFSGFL